MWLFSFHKSPEATLNPLGIISNMLLPFFSVSFDPQGSLCYYDLKKLSSFASKILLSHSSISQSGAFLMSASLFSFYCPLILEILQVLVFDLLTLSRFHFSKGLNYKKSMFWPSASTFVPNSWLTLNILKLFFNIAYLFHHINLYLGWFL